MFRPRFFISEARARKPAGWQAGSPPLKVTPESRGFSSTALTILFMSQSKPALKSWVTALWQPGHLCGQPWQNTTNLMPGPSTMDSRTTPASLRESLIAVSRSQSRCRVWLCPFPLKFWRRSSCPWCRPGSR